MADEFAEKTEKPTGRRLADAQRKGQFARTMEIQNVFVLTAGFVTLLITGSQIFRVITTSMTETWGQLGYLTISLNSVQGFFTTFAYWLAVCVLPVMLAAVVAGVVAGGLQSRFHLSFDRLDLNWARLDPANNIKQMFRPVASMMRTLIGILKLGLIIGLIIFVVKRLLEHPIFYSGTSFGEVLLFMAEAVRSITTRVLIGLAIIAAIDYAYQVWKTQKDLMMTKTEVKEETKSAEGNPQIKGELRKRRVSLLREMIMREIPKADVVVTNPTHLSVALRYDRKKMRAPRVVAKGARFNALRIREIARDFQIPIVENKPVAQFLFKHCKVGQEIPPDVYAAVAEILAYVYRTNRFRYYVEGQQIPS